MGRKKEPSKINLSELERLFQEYGTESHFAVGHIPALIHAVRAARSLLKHYDKEPDYSGHLAHERWLEASSPLWADLDSALAVFTDGGEE